MRKDVIRVGDKVRVLRPRFIERVGYDNNLQDTKEDLAERYEEEFVELVRQIRAKEGFKGNYTRISRKALYKLAAGVAYEIVGTRIKEGAERKLFYTKHDTCSLSYSPELGTSLEVMGTKIVKTGKYFGPTYSRSDWGYSGSFMELDCPGGLSEEKTHKLLKLEYCTDWIEVCDVEKVLDS